LSYGIKPEQIAEEYDLDIHKVKEAQAFYNVHRVEIDGSIKVEEELELNN
jgi:uncharacterized protein (DUF433 family)